MKITETTTRECCQGRDLVPVVGPGKPCGRRWYFCKHCGRWHVDLGGSEPESPGIQPLPWPWETEKKLVAMEQQLDLYRAKYDHNVRVDPASAEPVWRVSTNSGG